MVTMLANIIVVHICLFSFMLFAGLQKSCSAAR
jgi:hypothetical protein